MNRNAKRLYFQSFQTSSDFWDALKIHFSDKQVKREKIFLKNVNDDVISDEKTLSNIFNDYFVNITSTLNLNTKNEQTSSTDDSKTIVSYFKDHDSIKTIFTARKNGVIR